jgi:predicted nuclease of predicted toxin-antitoxin system
MCIDVRVVSWLNSQGHDATHLRDEGLQRMPNGEIFGKAVAEARIVVTFDLDFGEIVALSKERKTGVILFRLRNTRASFGDSAALNRDFRMRRRFGERRYCDRRGDSTPSQGISVDPRKGQPPPGSPISRQAKRERKLVQVVQAVQPRCSVQDV